MHTKKFQAHLSADFVYVCVNDSDFNKAAQRDNETVANHVRLNLTFSTYQNEWNP